MCQSIKRAQWQDKLKDRLFKVPYVHTVFTIPHELNRMAKRYPKELYNLVLRSSWQTVKELASLDENIGALPGMVSILHTFGSDLKFHLHSHCLVTFGGFREGKWIWPKRKKKIAPYLAMCSNYKRIFINRLDLLVKSKVIIWPNYEELRKDILDNDGMLEVHFQQWIPD